MTLDHDTEHLTPRERDVLALATRGLRNEEIAAELGLTENAVRFHLKRLHAKLDTGGDRKALSGFRGWLSGGAFLFGGNAVAAMPIIGLGVLGLGLAGAAVLFYPGDGNSASYGEVTPDAQGFYPNGCPAVMSPQIGLETLDDFSRSYGIARDDLRARNPGLSDVGPLPADAEVHLPYRPNTGCGQAQATPAGTTPFPGGTPAGGAVGGAQGFGLEVVSPVVGARLVGVGAQVDDAPVRASAANGTNPPASAVCIRLFHGDFIPEGNYERVRLEVDGRDHSESLEWTSDTGGGSSVGCYRPPVALADGFHEAWVTVVTGGSPDRAAAVTSTGKAAITGIRWRFEIK
jgi:DNA-binding CsgD family transcriptional regulator